MRFSKTGAHLLPDGNGGYKLVFDDTPKGREAERVYASHGCGVRQTYIAVYDGNHNRQFLEDKKVDQYARIQSFKDQCLIENIIKRCVGGDYSGLNRMQGMYGDVSNMPNNPRAMHDLLIRSKELYEKIPEEKKVQDFGGTFEGFLATFGDTQSLNKFISERLTNDTKEVKPDHGKE